MSKDGTELFEVFFDGQCPLCKREIEMVRRKDKLGLLRLTDISTAEYQTLAGKELIDLMKEIHGRYADGTLVTGVEVFREIYRRIGFGWLVSVSRLPVLKQLLDVAYCVFAYFRFRHASARLKRNGIDCRQCKIVTSKNET